MERPNPSLKIYVVGSHHGYRGFEQLPSIQFEAQKRFIPRGTNGITAGNNLFLQEMFDGTEAMSRAYKGLGIGQSLLAAYFRVNLSLSSEDITRRTIAIRRTPIEQSDYLYSHLLMIDELRKSINLVVDCEHYSDQQGSEHRKSANSIQQLIDLAIDRLKKGQFKDMNRLYAESLVVEAKPFHLRNRAIAEIVREDVEELSSNQLPTVVMIQMGFGHVKDLIQEIKGKFTKVGQNPLVGEVYVGPTKSFRYDLINKLIANPNSRLDQNLVNIALLHSVLDMFPLPDMIRGMDRNSWYDLLKRANSIEIDRLQRKIANLGLVDGITQFIKSKGR